MRELRRIVQRLPLDLCNVLKETGAHARILRLIVVVVVDQQRSCVGRSNARGGRLCREPVVRSDPGVMGGIGVDWLGMDELGRIAKGVFR